jgi:predicted RNA binding protein YcfA (HicA-like mRNA interferase family)
VDASNFTADACVKRLTDLGFVIGQTGVGMTLLRKNDRRVIVPHVTIEPPMLRAILRSAGVSEADFLRSPSRSGVYAKTPIPRVTPRKAGDRER